MEAVFLQILNMSITASWLVLAVVLLRVALKKAPKFITCILWGLVGLRLILPFSIESVLSLIPSTTTIPREFLYTDEPAIDSGITAVDNIVNPVITDNFSAETGASVNPLEIVTFIASILWIVGIISMVTYCVISYIKLCRKVSASINVRDNVYYCDDISTPFILGIIKPRIYLPSGITENQAEYVIAHENAHIKRRDHWWKPLGFLLLCVYWFNPIIWVAYVLLCRDIEMACDEKVIKNMDNEYKAEYSETLVECSTHQRRMIMACPLSFGEVGVKDRIKSVLSYKKPTLWIIIVAIIACIAVTVGFMTNPIIKDFKKSNTENIVTEIDSSNINSNLLTNIDNNGFYMFENDKQSVVMLKKSSGKAYNSYCEVVGDCVNIYYNSDDSKTESNTICNTAYSIDKKYANDDTTIVVYLNGKKSSFNEVIVTDDEILNNGKTTSNNNYLEINGNASYPEVDIHITELQLDGNEPYIVIEWDNNSGVTLEETDTYNFYKKQYQAKEVVGSVEVEPSLISKNKLTRKLSLKNIDLSENGIHLIETEFKATEWNVTYDAKLKFRVNNNKLRDYYTLNYNDKKYTYSYEIRDKSGKVILEDKNVKSTSVTIEDVSDTVLKRRVYSGPSTATVNTIYCDVNSGRASVQYYGVLAEYENKVIYWSNPDGKNLRLIVRNFFDKDVFYKEIYLGYTPSIEPISGFRIQGNTAYITYWKSDTKNNSLESAYEETITIDLTTTDNSFKKFIKPDIDTLYSYSYDDETGITGFEIRDLYGNVLLKGEERFSYMDDSGYEIKAVSDTVLKWTNGWGAIFCDVEKGIISKNFTQTLHAYKTNVLYYDNSNPKDVKLVVRDVFDKDLLYKEMKLGKETDDDPIYVRKNSYGSLAILEYEWTEDTGLGTNIAYTDEIKIYLTEDNSKDTRITIEKYDSKE